MASDVAPIERLQDRPIAADPIAIEQEFTRLWQETSGGGHDESIVRLRVANVVGIGRGEAALDRFETLMQALPQSHPCRGILALASADRTTLEASISAHCFPAPGNRRSVCSEEVLLLGGETHERELASSVLPLLVPELPVSVWLIDTPRLDRYLTQAALEAADRVIFDSAVVSDVATAYRITLDIRRAYEIEVSDLAWWRTEAWRLLAAQLFDGKDGVRELAQVSAIEARGNGGAGASDAMLAVSWLASRLGLTVADSNVAGNALNATMYAGSRGVRVSVADSGAGSGIESLTITTADARFEIACHPESQHIHVREDWDGGSSRRTVAQAREDDATMIAAALDGAPDAAIYEAAAEMALSLLQAGG
jgi:glucose-6-phosphate dehydrogenase assembly protein OpcA